MNVLKRITLVINWLCAVALGIAALAWVAASVFRWNFVSDVEIYRLYLAGWDYTVMTLAGCALLILNFAVIADWAVGLVRSPYLFLQTGAGRVSVSTRALSDAMKRAVTGLDEVSGARIVVKAPRKAGRAVVVNAHVTMKEDVSYQNVSRAITNAIEAKFTDIVGGGAAVETHVFWEKIRQGAAKPASLQAPQVDQLRPQFPVDEDET